MSGVTCIRSAGGRRLPHSPLEIRYNFFQRFTAIMLRVATFHTLLHFIVPVSCSNSKARMSRFVGANLKGSQANHREDRGAEIILYIEIQKLSRVLIDIIIVSRQENKTVNVIFSCELASGSCPYITCRLKKIGS